MTSLVHYVFFYKLFDLLSSNADKMKKIHDIRVFLLIFLITKITLEREFNRKTFFLLDIPPNSLRKKLEYCSFSHFIRFKISTKKVPQKKIILFLFIQNIYQSFVERKIQHFFNTSKLSER